MSDDRAFVSIEQAEKDSSFDHLLHASDDYSSSSNSDLFNKIKANKSLRDCLAHLSTEEHYNQVVSVVCYDQHSVSSYDEDDHEDEGTEEDDVSVVESSDGMTAYRLERLSNLPCEVLEGLSDIIQRTIETKRSKQKKVRGNTPPSPLTSSSSSTRQRTPSPATNINNNTNNNRSPSPSTPLSSRLQKDVLQRMEQEHKHIARKSRRQQQQQQESGVHTRHRRSHSGSALGSSPLSLDYQQHTTTKKLSSTSTTNSSSTSSFASSSNDSYPLHSSSSTTDFEFVSERTLRKLTGKQQQQQHEHELVDEADLAYFPEMSLEDCEVMSYTESESATSDLYSSHHDELRQQGGQEGQEEQVQDRSNHHHRPRLLQSSSFPKVSSGNSKKNTPTKTATDDDLLLDLDMFARNKGAVIESVAMFRSGRGFSPDETSPTLFFTSPSTSVSSGNSGSSTTAGSGSNSLLSSSSSSSSKDMKRVVHLTKRSPVARKERARKSQAVLNPSPNSPIHLSILPEDLKAPSLTRQISSPSSAFSNLPTSL